MTRPWVALVGGGASGTLLALQLVRQARRPLGVTLFEPRREIGRGLAYVATHPVQLLNVAAPRMSALPDEPGHFVAWLERSDAPGSSCAFVPRALYGRYLEQTLACALRAARPGVVFKRIRASVQALAVCEGGVTLRLEGGQELAGAARVALALGHFPGQGPCPELLGDARYVVDPWAPEALERLGRDDALMVVGTGLTMVDVALALHASGRRAPLLALSRHGLAPRTHAPTVAYADGPPGAPDTLRHWLRALRARVAGGSDWRACVDSLRPHTPAMWQRLSPPERRRFLRHVRAYWEVHRHRVAPAAGRAFEALCRRGLVRLRAGRLRGARPAGDELEVEWTPRGAAQAEVTRVRWLVNATGPQADLERVRSPLVERLVRQGDACLDPLRLGLDALPDGRLVGRDGRASSLLFTLGPPLRGVLWESTAIPEIRVQAAALARTWLDALEADPPEA